MDKNKAQQVYVLSVNELGQKVYTSETDPSKRLEILSYKMHADNY